MNEDQNNLSIECNRILDEWISSCTRGGKISRNTVAVGIVVLDHLIQNCPVSREDVISQGGEVKGARSGLGNILEKYNIPRTYLKEATTRQVHQDGQHLFRMFDWGNLLCDLSESERTEILKSLIVRFSQIAYEWLKKQNLKLEIDRRQAPTTWIKLIVESAKSRSGGVVEQHLIGAKLEKRFKDRNIPNYPAHAADIQTAREGDFTIANNVYHVTAAPGPAVVQKCAANIRTGKNPILLIPKERVEKAKALAEIEGIEKELTIISIEDFIAVNIIELATEEEKDFYSVLKEFVEIYNRRLIEVETDLSLQIEVH
jgi:hypothetical protein